MKTLYFDCFSGAGGDMLAGALIDAGVNIDVLATHLARLSIAGFSVRAEKLRKQGFAATMFHVEPVSDKVQPHRHLSDIRAILDSSDLHTVVRNRAIAVFDRLADAEAEAHGITREKVHFHEVGAVDAIVDIVTIMLAVHELAPDRILCSPLPTGSGTVQCAHGVMPVPAPATAILLKGVPLAASDEKGELLTPTAAAVLTTLCQEFGPIPAMTIERIGLGAGTRDTKTLPNVVRALLGTATADSADDTVVLLEANIDDAPGEWVGHCVGRLLEHGALDAYCVPIYMKKNRPAVVLTVMCERSSVTELESVIFEETSTFGIRRHLAGRTKLERRHETVATPFGPIRVKVGSRHDRIIAVAPEYSDCADAASRNGVALRTVMEAASRAWSSSNTT